MGVGKECLTMTVTFSIIICSSYSSYQSSVPFLRFHLLAITISLRFELHRRKSKTSRKEKSRTSIGVESVGSSTSVVLPRPQHSTNSPSGSANGNFTIDVDDCHTGPSSSPEVNDAATTNMSSSVQQSSTVIEEQNERGPYTPAEGFKTPVDSVQVVETNATAVAEEASSPTGGDMDPHTLPKSKPKVEVVDLDSSKLVKITDLDSSVAALVGTAPTGKGSGFRVLDFADMGESTTDDVEEPCDSCAGVQPCEELDKESQIAEKTVTMDSVIDFTKTVNETAVIPTDDNADVTQEPHIMDEQLCSTPQEGQEEGKAYEITMTEEVDEDLAASERDEDMAAAVEESNGAQNNRQREEKHESEEEKRETTESSLEQRNDVKDEPLQEEEQCQAFAVADELQGINVESTEKEAIEAQHHDQGTDHPTRESATEQACTDEWQSKEEQGTCGNECTLLSSQGLTEDALPASAYPTSLEELAIEAVDAPIALNMESAPLVAARGAELASESVLVKKGNETTSPITVNGSVSFSEEEKGEMSNVVIGASKVNNMQADDLAVASVEPDNSGDQEETMRGTHTPEMAIVEDAAPKTGSETSPDLDGKGETMSPTTSLNNTISSTGPTAVAQGLITPAPPEKPAWMG